MPLRLVKQFPYIALDDHWHLESLLIECYELSMNSPDRPFFKRKPHQSRYKMRKLVGGGLIKKNGANEYWLTPDGLRHARNIVRDRNQLNESV